MPGGRSGAVPWPRAAWPLLVTLWGASGCAAEPAAGGRDQGPADLRPGADLLPDSDLGAVADLDPARDQGLRPDQGPPADQGPTGDVGPGPGEVGVDLGIRDLGPGDLGPGDLGLPDGGAPDVSPAEAGSPDLGCPGEQEACGGGCHPPCPPVSGRGEDCRCVDLLPLPGPTGPRAGELLCLSARVPGGTGPQAEALQAFFFQQLATLGVRTLRHELFWHRIEPTPGERRWDEVDAQLALAEGHGVELLLLLAYGNPWASARGQATGDPYYPPDDPQDFADFAAAVAARYAGRVGKLEIWNEQNAGYRFWKRPGELSGDPAGYAALLAATGRSVGEVAPGTLVSFGGLFYLPQIIIGAEAFLAQAYAAEPLLGEAFHTLSYHPYSLYPPVDPPEYAGQVGDVTVYPLDETARRLAALVTNQEGAAKPLWITEVGWPTEQAVSELDQARFLVRGLLLALQSGLVDLYCPYTFMDGSPDGVHLAPWERVFGLHAWDGDLTDGTLPRAKPAVAALATVSRILGPLRLLADERARFRLPGGAYLLAFGPDPAAAPAPGEPAPPRRVRVLWTRAGEQGVRLPLLPGALPSRVELLGEAEQPLVPDADGLVTLRATSSPVYLLERVPP